MGILRNTPKIPKMHSMLFPLYKAESSDSAFCFIGHFALDDARQDIGRIVPSIGAKGAAVGREVAVELRPEEIPPLRKTHQMEHRGRIR